MEDSVVSVKVTTMLAEDEATVSDELGAEETLVDPVRVVVRENCVVLVLHFFLAAPEPKSKALARTPWRTCWTRIVTLKTCGNE